jgi:hypothetical protein
MHNQHNWKSLAKAHGNTHLIKSLKPILDYFKSTLLICDSGRLMWSLEGKNNPSKTYIRNVVKLREIYWNYRDSSKRPWKINVGKRGMKHTHLDRWTCASGKWMIPRHEWSPRYKTAHGWKVWVWTCHQGTWELMKQKELRSIIIFFLTFILFPSHFFLFPFFLLLFSYFSFLLIIFFSFFSFAPQKFCNIILT